MLVVSYVVLAESKLRESVLADSKLRKSVLAESKLRKSVVAESWKSRLSSRTLGDRMGF